MIRLPGTLTIAAVGRLRNPHWLAAQQEYAGRLQRYTELTIVEVRDQVGGPTPDQVAVEREGATLLDAVKGISWTIALDAKGKQATSEGFAAYLHKQVAVYRDVAFLIGGPLGHGEELLAACDEHLSLSLLTFPHELVRVMLLEQLYRAMTILSGEPYHK